MTDPLHEAISNYAELYLTECQTLLAWLEQRERHPILTLLVLSAVLQGYLQLALDKGGPQQPLRRTMTDLKDLGVIISRQLGSTMSNHHRPQ